MNLYVTDLDGTLLNSEQRLSDNTVNIINELIDKGMNFSIATARSCQSAAVVLEKLNLKLPVILTNGVYVYDTLKKENLVFNNMDSTMAYEIVNRAKEKGLSPIVITKDKESGKIYYRGVFNPGEEDYIQDRINNNDRRLRLVDEIPDVRCETVVTVVFIDEDKKIAPFYEELRSKYDLMYHYGEDIYTKYYWLEITHRDSDKGRGALFLKDYVGADKLICFGDHMNDISMFKMADEAYAVGNAVQELKDIASGVIKDNDSDGVARYLQEALRDG